MLHSNDVYQNLGRHADEKRYVVVGTDETMPDAFWMDEDEMWVEDVQEASLFSLKDANYICTYVSGEGGRDHVAIRRAYLLPC